MSSAPVPSRSGLRLVGGEDSPLAVPLPRRPGDDRRSQDVARENRLAAHANRHGGIESADIDTRDPRWVLAMQTQARLQGAMLTPERRDELLKSGRRMGLRPFEANLVIAVVQDRARINQPLRFAAPTLTLDENGRDSDARSSGHGRAGLMVQCFLAGALAALAAVAVIRWLASTP